MEKRENLKPCPFCGVMPHIYWEAWKDISPDAGVWKLEANHKDSCYITHINGTNISGRSSARRLSQLVEWWNHREELFGNSEQLPSAQQERKTGRWVERNPQNSPVCRLIECSECGNGYIVGYNIDYDDWINGRNFCMRCGADLRGGNNG